MLFYRILGNISLLLQGKITLRQIPPKIINCTFNYCRLARHVKRSKFAIEGVVFRALEENDGVRYREFIEHYLKRSITGAVNKPHIPECGSQAFCYIALYQNKIVGKVELRRVACDNTGAWQVAGLSISEDLRGLGIGEQLLKSGITAIGENNPTLVLDVNKENIRAIKLYRKLGFRTADGQEKLKLKTVYPRLIPEKIIMVKGA